MRFMTLASGSSGNCTFVGTDNTAILVDAGISRKKIKEGINSIDIDFSDLSGILITHEHIDHVNSLGVISRSYGIPIYATEGTCEAIIASGKLGKIDSTLFNIITPDKSFNIGDIEVEAHTIWHDAADPVCYSLASGNKKISIATDMGDYDDYIVNALSGSDVIMIETNHDIRMLQAGIYPYHLKQRILGKRGHLCNEAGASLIASLLNEHIKGIFLGHLSKENNIPDLAYETVKLELNDNKFTSDIRDFNLTVAASDSCSKLLEY